MNHQRGRIAIDTIFDLLVLARWVHFTSLFVLFGCSAFWLTIVPVGRSGTPAAFAWSIRKTIQIIRIAAVLAALSGVAWLVTTIANMMGSFADVTDPETLHAFFFETAFGPLSIMRLIVLASMIVCAIVPMPAELRFIAMAAQSVLLLISQAWLGHAAEDGGTVYGTTMIVSYGAHVLAGAAWIGGLPPLLLAIVEQRTSIDPDRNAGMLHLLKRYSAMAILAVSVIVISGIANTAFHLGLALDSTYGEILFVKLVLVFVMLTLGGMNRFVMMPHLSRDPLMSAGALEHQPEKCAAVFGKKLMRHNALGRSIAIECVVALMVLASVALLGITPPPH